MNILFLVEVNRRHQPTCMILGLFNVNLALYHAIGYLIDNSILVWPKSNKNYLLSEIDLNWEFS